VTNDPIRGEDSVLVLCMVMSPDGKAHETNQRQALMDILDDEINAEEPLYGFEQEYTMMKARAGCCQGVCAHHRGVPVLSLPSAVCAGLQLHPAQCTHIRASCAGGSSPLASSELATRVSVDNCIRRRRATTRTAGPWVAFTTPRRRAPSTAASARSPSTGGRSRRRTSTRASSAA
jgi:hypothetical protein